MPPTPSNSSSGPMNEGRRVLEGGTDDSVKPIRLGHEVFGPSGRRTVVLLHGLTNSRDRYSSLIAWLVARGLQVVNVDLRGHGQSGWAASYRARDYADDVAELILESELAPAVAIGHSLGGVVGSTLATAHPGLISALFMEDPPLFQADESIRNADQEIAQFPAFLDQMRSWHEAEVTEIDLAREMAEWPSPYPELKLGDIHSTERLQTRATAYLACDPLTVEAAINGSLWFGCDPDAPIECPLTVVAADPSLNAMFRPEHAKRLRAAVPHANVVQVDKVAHSILDSPARPGAFRHLLEEFLDSL